MTCGNGYDRSQARNLVTGVSKHSPELTNRPIAGVPVYVARLSDVPAADQC